MVYTCAVLYFCEIDCCTFRSGSLSVFCRLLWFGCVCQYHVFSVVVLVTGGPKSRVSDLFHVFVSNIMIYSIYGIKNSRYW